MPDMQGDRLRKGAERTRTAGSAERITLGERIRTDLGRLACACGFHAWEAETERVARPSGSTLLFTFNRCRRADCRYEPGLLVNVERDPLELFVYRVGCRCRRHAWAPDCPVHGRRREGAAA